AERPAVLGDPERRSDRILLPVRLVLPGAVPGAVAARAHRGAHAARGSQAPRAGRGDRAPWPAAGVGEVTSFPGRADRRSAASPESINANVPIESRLGLESYGYGFRARRCAAPRNDHYLIPSLSNPACALARSGFSSSAL